ncbi:MAG: tRNA epoxyqueuosine(34) reductase QueG [Anaerolineales bacterium]|nr:tRNA epoxyqueuosine(34) reductase QueG [Anaerolineales bacterium]MCB9145972.1 tRNA epoxyqueuosine(34) reductase QueG [Anaerolineales bacterium]
MFNKHELTQAIKNKTRQLGFILAGVTSSASPAHFGIYEEWLGTEHHATMEYLASDRNRNRRADPKLILPECQSILVLAIPYRPVSHSSFRIASYALGNDYHDIIPPRLQEIVNFIEEQVGHPVPNRYYTDTGPILERELAKRAGLGWIGKNSMLINPQAGSTFLLAEILLGIELEFDEPFTTDHCGTCTRCIDACPTTCILPNRTIDSRICISYLTIENKGPIPEHVRDKTGNWIFGCDICQQVCPWNRFSPPADAELEPNIPLPISTESLNLTSPEFNQRFKRSPIQRAKRRGYLRNLAVATGNAGSEKDIPALEKLEQDEEPLVQEHAKWAKEKIERRSGTI